jgi:hypothetical protein
MKKILHIILIFFAVSEGNSQVNLIPNGDFEEGPNRTSAEWEFGIDNICSSIDDVSGPDFWTVTKASPDRLIEGDIPCNWDDAPAQSGQAYIMLGYIPPSGEAGKTILTLPLKKDSTYKLAYYVRLETFRGTSLDPFRIAFNFNNGGNTIISKNIVDYQNWIYFDTVFIAESESTEIEIQGYDAVFSGAKIDNISLIEFFNTSELEKIDNLKFNVYPNPCSGILNIESMINYEANIYNIVGEKIYVIEYHKENATQYDLTKLPKGVYQLHIKLQNQIINKKIILN